MSEPIKLSEEGERLLCEYTRAVTQIELGDGVFINYQKERDELRAHMAALEAENAELKQVREALRQEVRAQGDRIRELEMQNVQMQNVIDGAKVCPECNGSGSLGRVSDGRLIACETCGGHEDALGRGIILPD